MALAVLRCNIQSCKILLDDAPFRLPCSHQFCLHHGNMTIKAGKCLICSTPLNDLFGFINNLPDQEFNVPSPSVPFYQKPFCRGCQEKDDIIKNCQKQNEILNLQLARNNEMIAELQENAAKKTAELGKCKSDLMTNNQLIRDIQFELGLLRTQIQPNPNIYDPNINPYAASYSGNGTYRKIKFGSSEDGQQPDKPNGRAIKGCKNQQ